jgi:hypothetical protein
MHHGKSSYRAVHACMAQILLTFHDQCEESTKEQHYTKSEGGKYQNEQTKCILIKVTYR